MVSYWLTGKELMSNHVSLIVIYGATWATFNLKLGKKIHLEKILILQEMEISCPKKA